MVCRSDSCPRPLCLTHKITQLACWLKRPKVLLCATRTVRSLHPTSFCANLPKHKWEIVCLDCCLCHKYIWTRHNGSTFLWVDVNNCVTDTITLLRDLTYKRQFSDVLFSQTVPLGGWRRLLCCHILRMTQPPTHAQSVIPTKNPHFMRLFAWLTLAYAVL